MGLPALQIAKGRGPGEGRDHHAGGGGREMGPFPFSLEFAPALEPEGQQAGEEPPKEPGFFQMPVQELAQPIRISSLLSPEGLPSNSSAGGAAAA